MFTFIGIMVLWVAVIIIYEAFTNYINKDIAKTPAYSIGLVCQACGIPVKNGEDFCNDDCKEDYYLECIGADLFDEANKEFKG